MNVADLPAENVDAYELLLDIDEARVMTRGAAPDDLLALLVELKLVVVDRETDALELTRAGVALAWGAFDAEPLGSEEVTR
jgi:hypothetical protein